MAYKGFRPLQNYFFTGSLRFSFLWERQNEKFVIRSSRKL